MDLLLPLALIAAGLVLIAVEVYVIPGFNVVGVAGVLVAGAGVGYAFAAGGAVVGLAALAGALVAGGALFYALWRGGAWDRFVLSDTLHRDHETDADGAARQGMLGKTGVALSPLRPTGVAEIEGARLEVVTEGAFVAAGSRVRVVAVDRQRRYFVRLAEGEAERA